MSPSSRQRTLHTLSEFRPAFRAIASGLTDLDLVFIEEAFERLLLDYDRALHFSLFSSFSLGGRWRVEVVEDEEAGEKGEGRRKMDADQRG